MEINQEIVKNRPYEKGISFHEAIRPVLKLARIFSLMPIQGINGVNSSALYFEYYSWQIFYSAITALFIGIMLGFISFWIFDTPMNFGKIVILIFYGSNFAVVIFIMRLSREWPRLIRKWTNVENKLPQYRTLKDRYLLGKQIKWITFLVMILSFAEHFLSITSGMYTFYKCSSTKHDILEGYIRSNMPQLFHIFSGYSIFKAICVMIFNLYCTFVWNFMDLFIIVISVGLSRQFNQIYCSMVRNKENKCSEFYWKYHRECYHELVELLRNADSSISNLILLSFLNNLFFICIQLFNSLNVQSNVVGAIYFWYSMMFLIGRTFSVAISAAQIHEESKKPLVVIRGLSTTCWNTEVIRFNEQLVNDHVALSGKQFFHVTRSLILTIAGTVVTYELVLIQSGNQTINNIACT